MSDESKSKWNGQKFNLKTVLSRCPNRAIADELGHICEALELSTTDEYFDPDAAAWLGGGAIRRALLGQPLGEGDLDVFFRGVEQRDAWIKRFSANERDNWTTGHGPNSLHPRCDAHGNISFLGWNKRYTALHGKAYKIECNAAFFPSMDKVIESFDFTICQLITDGKVLYAGHWTMIDLMTRSLRITANGVNSPRRTIYRVPKYEKQGFKATPATYFPILSQIAANPALLYEDQRTPTSGGEEDE